MENKPVKEMTLKDFLKETPARGKGTKTKPFDSEFYDDSVTVHVNMSESSASSSDNRRMLQTLTAQRHRLEAARTVATMTTSSQKNASGEDSGKMEVKITINMKQLEKHHRDIESYISPFTPSPDSIFLRIPPRPEDYARIENARDELDLLVRYVHQMTPGTIPDDEARDFLQKLRMLDVRLTALYPRQPAPGDKNKKSYRMCPCYEPEVEDVERLVVYYNQVFRGLKYINQMKKYMAERSAIANQVLREQSSSPSSSESDSTDSMSDEFQKIQESFEKMSLNETA